MEDVIRRSGGGDVVKEEGRSVNSGGGDDGGRNEVVVAKVGSNLRSSSSEKEELSLIKKIAIKENRSTMESDPKAPSSSQTEQDARLESARAEMGEALEENQRLKMYLNQIKKDYQALQMQFYDIIRQEETKKSTDTAINNQAFEEHDLVSLSLGFSRDPKKDNNIETKNGQTSGKGADDEQVKKGLSLGLDCKFDVSESDISEKQSPVNSFEEAKEESSVTWPPGKALKMTRSGNDESMEQNPVKKARVSVRARCDTPNMNDGCQWRKYGQKIAKGNPCPRAYYRCTVGPSCPVRKQVQRCADDMSILITTYEGTHNHPLPVSATAMASTTSAAASMLLSGSSSSSSSLTGPSPSASTIAASALHGLKFYLSDNSQLSNKPFYIQNPSLASSSSYPTITLDLTSNPPSSSSHFNRFSSSSYLPVPKFPPTSLNFGSSEPSTTSWGNLFPGYASSTSQQYNRNQLGTLNVGKQSVDSSIYQSYLQTNPPHHQPSLLPADTIAAATKAITADPSFQSALAAALTSLIGTGSGRSAAGGGGGGGGNANPGNGDNFAQKLKWAEHFPVASGYMTSPKGNACASSYINKTTTSNPQPGSLVFLPPSLPFSAPEGASTSPGNNRDHAT